MARRHSHRLYELQAIAIYQQLISYHILLFPLFVYIYARAYPIKAYNGVALYTDPYITKLSI